MFMTTRQARVWALASLGLLGLAALPAHAQFRIQGSRGSSNISGRNTVVNQEAGWYNRTSAINARNYNIATRGFRSPVVGVPTYAPGAYGGGYYPGESGGFLHGAADVITSQGQLAQTLEQNKVIKQQAEQAKIDTRRKSFDEYMYERANRPTNEDERERIRLEKIRRTRNGPPLTEIWSGKALNDMLMAIQRMQVQSVPGPTVPLEPDLLRHINVTTGSTAGSVGIFRNNGKPQWPLTLRTSAFATERKKMDGLTAKAYMQVQAGEVDADTLVALNQGVDDMRAQLKRKISSLSPNDYIKSKRYLNEFEDALKVLQSPDATKLVTQKLSARGDTVAQLCADMTQQGLKFAPALDGDQSAYTALHSAMVQYYSLPGRPWDPAAK